MEQTGNVGCIARLVGTFDAINGISAEGANSDVSGAQLRWTGAAGAT
jgi:hypothetical protein